jgi:hypothetical protein
MKKIILLLSVTLLLTGAGCTIRTVSEQDSTSESQDEIALQDQTQLDSDNDGLTDYYEINTSNTDPEDSDTDDDGYSDGTEVKEGYDPLVPATTQTIHVQDSQEQDGVNLNTDIETDITTITNCGADETCMNNKLLNCEKAKLELDAGFAAVSYEITGSVVGGCGVTFIYTTNPNPTWVNQPMYCVVDTSANFVDTMQDAIETTFAGEPGCTGPLVEILHSN